MKKGIIYSVFAVMAIAVAAVVSYSFSVQADLQILQEEAVEVVNNAEEVLPPSKCCCPEGYDRRIRDRRDRYEEYDKNGDNLVCIKRVDGNGNAGHGRVVKDNNQPCKDPRQRCPRQRP